MHAYVRLRDVFVADKLNNKIFYCIRFALFSWNFVTSAALNRLFLISAEVLIGGFTVHFPGIW